VTSAAIAARGLEKRFGHAVALRGIDFEVPVGSSLAILGPNGAGKSTLLRLVAGLSRPTGGTLTIGGDDSHQRRTRARIGYIGHSTLLYSALTARENLIFAARCHGLPQPAERADHLLGEEGLLPVANRAAGAFSRGMAQRLAIARGLVHDPEVVLFDEPFTGLDRGSAKRFAARIEDMRRQGRTLVLVTHDVGYAAEFGDAAIVLSGGRILHTETAPLDAASLEIATLAAGDAQA
jgi:heme exporter protein A